MGIERTELFCWKIFMVNFHMLFEISTIMAFNGNPMTIGQRHAQFKQMERTLLLLRIDYSYLGVKISKYCNLLQSS